MLKNKFDFKFFSFLILPLILYLPIFFLNDIWDGVTFQYASDQNDFSGAKRWALESGYIIQYFKYILLNHISNLFNIKFNFLIDFTFIILLFLISLEIYFIQSKIFKLDKKISYFSIILFLTFPSHHIVVSSILLIHYVCLYFSVFGTRLLFYEKIYLKIIGFLLILISLQLNSNFLYVPGLYFIYSICYKEKKILLKNSILILTLIILFFILKKYFPSYGEYASYNKISLKLNFFDIFNKLKMFFSFLTFIIFPTSICLLFYFLLKFFKIRIYKFKISLYYFIYCNIILICSIIPYIVVNKYTHLFDAVEWYQRHSILMSFPYALIMGLLSTQIIINLNFRTKTFSLYPFLLITLFLNLFIFTGAIYKKVERQLFDINLINNLQNIDPPPSGLVEIVSKNIPSPAHRSYESNYLLYNAYGLSDWHSRIGREVKIDFDYPIWINNKNSILYKKHYISNNLKTGCKTNITLGEGLDFFERIKSFYIFQSHKLYSIEEVIIKCEK